MALFDMFLYLHFSNFARSWWKNWHTTSTWNLQMMFCNGSARLRTKRPFKGLPAVVALPAGTLLPVLTIPPAKTRAIFLKSSALPWTLSPTISQRNCLNQLLLNNIFNDFIIQFETLNCSGRIRRTAYLLLISLSVWVCWRNYPKH